MQSLFISSPEEYQRDINPMASYVKLSSFYIAKMTNTDESEARTWLSTQLVQRNPVIMSKVPQIKYLSKEHGNQRDRQVTYDYLDKYIGSIANSNKILAPTGTVYKHPSSERSLFTYYVDDGRTKRAYFKGLMHEAKVSGDRDTADFNNERQNTAKIDNNTLSGAQLSPATILHQQSAHPTLTSTGRVSTTIANLMNERLLVGNMHYADPDIALEHMNVLAYTAKHELIQRCIDELGLVVPTVDDVMKMISKSIRYYFVGKRYERIFSDFLEKCSDTERCNIMYNGSMWNLIQLNPKLMYEMIDSLSEPDTTAYEFEKADAVIKSMYAELKILSVSLCYEHMRGKSLSGAKSGDHHAYGLVASTIDKLSNLLEKYQYLIEAFFKLEILPNNLYDVETLHRLSVVTSDTDSTNFSCQEICKFMTGKYGVTDKDTKVTFLMTYFSSMMVAQALGIMSTNIGVEMPRIRELEMKNEFFIPIHCLTTSAKNYIMLQGAQEGNILPELDLVTKGVELRNSRIPKSILDQFDTYKKSIFFRVAKGETLTMMDIIKPIVDLERVVLEGFRSGDTKYIGVIHVKTPDSYSDEEEASQWKYHLMYEGVFGYKYGHVTDVPYVGYLVSVDLGNRTKIKRWLDSIEDPVFKETATKYIEDNQITKINKMVFPDIFFSGSPLPKEIHKVITVNNMCVQMLSPWYLLLESFGIFLRNAYDSKLVSQVFGDFVDHPSYMSKHLLTDELHDLEAA